MSVCVSFFDTFYDKKRRKENEEKSFAAAAAAGGREKKSKKIICFTRRKGRAQTYSLTQHNFCDGSSRVGANTRQSGTKSVREAPKFEAW